jgi:hypothetical protein
MFSAAGLMGGARQPDRRFPFYLAIQITSVIIPGVVSVAAIAFFADRLHHVRLTFGVNHLTGAASIIFLVFALAIGYVVGYVLRELSFKVLGHLERMIPSRSHATITYEQLSDAFGAEIVTSCLRAHPYLSRPRHPAESQSPHPDYRVGGGHLATDYLQDFVYAKLWLRNYSPNFGVDLLELEINTLAATVVPILLGGLVLVTLAGFRWWAYLACILVVLSLEWFVMQSLFRLRYAERWESFRNLIMDYAARIAVASYPAADVVVEQAAPSGHSNRPSSYGVAAQIRQDAGIERPGEAEDEQPDLDLG